MSKEVLEQVYDYGDGSNYFHSNPDWIRCPYCEAQGPIDCFQLISIIKENNFQNTAECANCKKVFEYKSDAGDACYLSPPLGQERLLKDITDNEKKTTDLYSVGGELIEMTSDEVKEYVEDPSVFGFDKESNSDKDGKTALAIGSGDTIVLEDGKAPVVEKTSEETVLAGEIDVFAHRVDEIHEWRDQLFNMSARIRECHKKNRAIEEENKRLKTRAQRAEDAYDERISTCEDTQKILSAVKSVLQKTQNDLINLRYAMTQYTTRYSGLGGLLKFLLGQYNPLEFIRGLGDKVSKMTLMTISDSDAWQEISTLARMTNACVEMGKALSPAQKSPKVPKPNLKPSPEKPSEI